MLKQPSWTRFLPEAFVLNLSTLGRLGSFPAPGTWGSLAGVLWFTVVCVPAGPLGALLVTAGLVYLGFAFCGEAEFRMRKIDPPELILDEFVCMPIVLLGFDDVIATREAWMVFLLGFGLFRFFDIVKPIGIHALQRFPGGMGVVADDFAAAVASWAILQGIMRFTPLLDLMRG